MKIKATFLDEISYDIPHQNWGVEEWDKDFQAMKAVGIDMVVLIRCGLRRQMTFPSEVLKREQSCFTPSTDLIQMFLDLAQKHDMKFFCGTYDFGISAIDPNYDPDAEAKVIKEVNDEIIERYGKHPAFSGWYLAQEIAGDGYRAADCYRDVAKRLKEKTNNLPIIISPFMRGSKVAGQITVDPKLHEEQWERILSKLQGLIDIIAFQDGHVQFEELPKFLKINKRLCDKYGMDCWTNAETFDRDMPIKFLPIKWDKLWWKLQAAESAGISNALTFEFSHFMSPNSCYHAAHGLYKRYQEYLAAQNEGK